MTCGHHTQKLGTKYSRTPKYLAKIELIVSRINPHTVGILNLKLFMMSTEERPNFNSFRPLDAKIFRHLNFAEEYKYNLICRS